jgi:hypothetical protein
MKGWLGLSPRIMGKGSKGSKARWRRWVTNASAMGELGSGREQ